MAVVLAGAVALAGASAGAAEGGMGGAPPTVLSVQPPLGQPMKGRDPAQAAGKASSGQAAAGTEGGVPLPVIGILDMQQIVTASTAARQVLEQRDKYLESYQNEAADEEKTLREMGQELMRQRTALGPEAFNARQEEIQRRAADYQRRVQSRKRNLERAFAQGMGEVQQAIVQATNQLANQKGINVVLYKTQAFLFDPAMDLTAAVLADVNRALPKATMPDPETLGDPAAGGGGR